MSPQETISAAGARAKTPHFVLLIALTALGPLSLHVFLPSMPGLQKVFGTTADTVQFVFTAYLLSLAAAQLVMGPLSDRFGRRPVMLAGLALFLAGTLLGLATNSIGWLIFARILQAVGSCAGMVLGRAMVRDVYGRERATEAIAYLTMATVVVPMLSPAMGGVLDQHYGWHAVFYLMLAYGVVMTAISVRSLHETHHERHSVGAMGLLYGFVILVGLARFRGYAFNTALSVGAFFGFAGTAPRIAVEELGLTPISYGVCFMSISIAFMAGNFGAARLTRRFGGELMMLAGGLIGLVALSAMLAAVLSNTLTATGMFAAVAAMAFGNGISLPSSTAGALSVDPMRAGAASGLVGFSQMGLGALASYIVPNVLDGGLVSMALVMVVFALLAVVSQLVWLGRPRLPRATA